MLLLLWKREEEGLNRCMMRQRRGAAGWKKRCLRFAVALLPADKSRVCRVYVCLGRGGGREKRPVVCAHDDEMRVRRQALYDRLITP